ncbi:MAG TPA: hypothetical protein VMW26_03445 [Methanomassiliicoccales archaeon]|nr:hypothetical protein [Methanomassiliicoccales archaeon]
MGASWALFIIMGGMSVMILMVNLTMNLDPVILLALMLSPLIVAAIFSNVPKGLAHNEEKVMTAESPRMIASITMSMQSRPNLERAVLFASERGGGVLSWKLRELLWSVITRRERDMVSAVLSFNSRLSDSNDGLRQAMHLVVSANFERTKNGLERLLDKANQIILENLKEAVDRYASSLTVPTMVLFSIGIIMPVMLFALLPLLSMGGMASSSLQPTGGEVLSEGMIALLMLLVFPLFCFLYARSILERNPIRVMDPLEVGFDPIFLLLPVSWTFIGIILAMVPLGIYGSYGLLMGIFLPPSVYLLLRTNDKGAGSKDAKRSEKEFANALYQIGNRMLTGASFEAAFEEAANSMDGSHFSRYAKKVVHLSRISREDITGLVGRSDLIGVESTVLEAAMNSVADSAKRDSQAAGKVALNLAQSMNDLRRGEARIEERLRGVIDMMRSTAVFFAPIVLGITSSLFGVIGAQTGQSLGSMEGIALIVGVYLMELGFIVTYFTTFLMGEGGWRNVAFQFSTRAPLALLIFVLTSLLSMNGMLSML